MNNTTEYTSEPEQQEKFSKMKDTEKKKKTTEQSISILWDNTKWSSICVIGVPEEGKQKNILLEEIMGKYFIFGIRCLPQIQDV